MSSTTTQNKAVVKRYLEEAWGRGKLLLIDELMAPDVSFSVTPFIPKELVGTERVKREPSFRHAVE